jgi:hypothetical protein
MQDIGTLGEHFATLFGEGLSDSSCSDRRTRLPWEIFADLLQPVLRPKATVRRRPEGFWRGLRLVALDGTQFSWSSPFDDADISNFRKALGLTTRCTRRPPRLGMGGRG